MEKEGFVGKAQAVHQVETIGEQLVSQGASLIRLENTTQIQVSMQHPRDEAKILGDALKELDLYPSMADEVLYSKPVGKDDNGKMKYAEGLSIRTAESLANRWKNSAFGCEITGEDSEGVILAAVFLDYESNTRHVVQKKVSRYYKSRQGIKTLHPVDRFADVVIPANQSKLLREVILRSLPAGLKLEYESKARAILGSGDKNKRITKLVAGFMRLGVSKSKLEELAGKKVEELTPEEITNLIGAGNAIKDGESTIEQLIVDKTNSEKLVERMSGNHEKPSEQNAILQTPSAVGLEGKRFSLYESVAISAAGDMMEINKILSTLSGGVIRDKETLISADDAMVSSVANKLSKYKR